MNDGLHSPAGSFLPFCFYLVPVGSECEGATVVVRSVGDDESEGEGEEKSLVGKSDESTGTTMGKRGARCSSTGQGGDVCSATAERRVQEGGRESAGAGLSLVAP